MSSLRNRLNPKHAVAIVYVAAMFVNILDSTVVTVILPTLSREFEVGTESIDWVVTGYLLSLAVWIPASGWIGDRVGTKRTFLFALVVFTGASALCGLSTSLGELVAFRILQGGGGGMLTPIGFAMLMRAFPPDERANASKILIIPTAIAPATGPIIGGLLTDWLSWRWVFYINLPVGLAAFVFGLMFLEEHREPRAGRLDVPGFILSGGGLAAILYALSQGPTRGWDSPLVLAAGAFGAGAFAALVVVELRIVAPMLQLRLLSDRLFSSVMLTSAFATGAFLGVLFTMPLFLQQARGVSALQSGLTTFPEALGVISLSQLSGRLYPDVGPRRLMAGGLLSLAMFLALLTTVDLTTSLWTIRLLMFAVGASMAFVFIPLQASAFARIPMSDTGRASAIYNTQRQMSSALGVAVLATVLAARLPASVGPSLHTPAGNQVPAFHDVFIVAAGIAMVGALVAFTVRDADAAATMRRGPGSRTAEPLAQPES
jgi:EmrB/QacA subfamily drug resistance transporter